MKRRIIAVFMTLVMLSGCIVTAGAETGSPAVPSGTDTAEREHAYEPFEEYEKAQYIRERPYEEGVVVFKQKTGGISLFGEDSGLEELGLSGIEKLELNSGIGLFSEETEAVYKAHTSGDVWETVDKLNEREDIVYAEPNYSFYAAGGEAASSGDSAAAEQWYAEDISLPQAWEHLRDSWYSDGGNADTVVAVIDTGVDYTHPDLRGAMWVNTGEIPGNGIDDDGNGYADDIYGCSTVSDRTEHSGDPMDDHGHGTHVAGIIGMDPYNGVGGAGVAYGCRIMALKAGQSSGLFSATDIAEAVSYASMMGADVINMSFVSYADSYLVKEALADAFGTSVLVASAGNDYIPALPELGGQNAYPAAYDWVIGVMAYGKGGSFASFSNFDTWPDSGGEYEIAAPGVDIYSTLPGERYGNWAGTSMAAPVVSAAAALLRAKYSDKTLYSSRYIMGQIVGAANGTIELNDPNYRECSFKKLDIYEALTLAPEPDVSYKEFYMFDSADIDSWNDGDGYADAGETIDLGIVLRNRWGGASDVRVSIDALSEGGIEDPYVSIIEGTVDYGSVGTYSEDDNGLIYEEDMITGVSSPFRIKISKDAPNDHVVKLNVAIEAKNGMDGSDNESYISADEISFVIQNGRKISGVIREDTTLTNDHYWIVDNAILIPEGVTLSVEPGTQIQFYQSEPYGIYEEPKSVYIEAEGKLDIRGTCDEPVEMFPSETFYGYPVSIRGNADIRYANIINADIDGNICDHTNFVYVDVSQNRIQLNEFSNSSVKDFFHINAYQAIVAKKTYAVNNVQFDSCSSDITLQSFKNCVFLGNYQTRHEWSQDHVYPLKLENCGVYMYDSRDQIYSDILEFNGSKYVVCQFPEGMPVTEFGEDVRTYDWQYRFFKYIAEKKGGELAVFETEEEFEDFKSAAEAWLEEQTGLKKIIFGYYVSEDGETRADSDKEGLYIPVTSHIHVPSPVSEELKDLNRIYYVMYPHYGFNIDVYEGYRGHQDKYALLKFPDTVPDEVITEYVDPKEFDPCTIENNAFLNAFAHPDSSRWMTITTDQKYGGCYSFKNNYWGTASADAIDRMITDQKDSVALARIDYEPYLTVPAESTYPFVSDISVLNSNGTEITQAGEENITVRVTFNRDMDMSVQPEVSFGPDEPYTDFMVRGGWTDPRTWEGTYAVSSSTGVGMQYFRVKDAVAADDAWLKTGTDRGRFEFEVISSGAEALTLQAYGAENRIELSWTQDDFETLAGYNIYRSGEPNGYYQRLNSSVIAPDIKEYTDTDVEPGVTYYYKFTVVQTDLTESAGSNIASAAALDNSAPVISHTPVTSAVYGQEKSVSATITDNIGVTYAVLYYRAEGSETWESTAMAYDSALQYTGVIPAEYMTGNVEYYIEAGDGVNTVRSGAPTLPHIIEVDHSPVISGFTPETSMVGGGGEFIVTGENFEEGAKVYIGEKEAAGAAVENVNTIKGILPENATGTYDVRVVNPTGEYGVLTKAVTYINENAGIQIGSASVLTEQYVVIPVSVNNADELTALDLQIYYDPDILEFINIERTDAAEGFIADSYDSGGAIRVSMASSDGITGNVNVFNINFRLRDDAELTETEISADNALINGIGCEVSPGYITKQQLYNITGRVGYYSNDAAVSGADVSFNDGVSVQTDESGAFTRSDLLPGSYTLAPSKAAGQSDISSYDAALALQKAVGKRELDEYQIIAADVNDDGTVNAMDASLILKMAAGKISGAFPGSGAVWSFVPDSMEIDLKKDEEVSFTAVELGDVSGNWGGTNIQSSGSAEDRVYHAPYGCTRLHIPIEAPEITENEGIIGIDIRLDVSDSSIGAVTARLAGALQQSCTLEQNVKDGILTVGIMSSSPISLQENEPLIMLDAELNGSFENGARIGIIQLVMNEAVKQSDICIDVTGPEAYISGVPEAGESLEVSLPLLENDKDMSSAVMCAAGYDASGRLLYLFADDNTDGSFSLNVTVRENADNVKVFLWNTGNLEPYMPCSSVRR